MTTLDEIARGAVTADSSEYLDLIHETGCLLKSEAGRGRNLRIEGRLAECESSGEAIIIGDLHGDLESLVHILTTSGFMEKATEKKILAIFLGDYGDRGPCSPEVYYAVMKLHQTFPQNVVLMRGNHEGPADLRPHPHDLPQSLLAKFGEAGNDVYARILSLHQQLFTSVFIGRSCALLHGGVPSNARSLHDLAYAHLTHPKATILEEILWSDPAEGIKGTRPSPRGAGCLFGQDITQGFLETFKVKILIRGHEPVDEGFKVNHEGRVLTLFSRKGAPYFNSAAAFLQLDLSQDVQSAYGLIQYVHQF